MCAGSLFWVWALHGGGGHGRRRVGARRGQAPQIWWHRLIGARRRWHCGLPLWRGGWAERRPSSPSRRADARISALWSGLARLRRQRSSGLGGGQTTWSGGQRRADYLERRLPLPPPGSSLRAMARAATASGGYACAFPALSLSLLYAVAPVLFTEERVTKFSYSVFTWLHM